MPSAIDALSYTDMLGGNLIGMAKHRTTPHGFIPLRMRHWPLAGVVLCLLCAGQARAALAGDQASVQSDAQAFGARSSQATQSTATVVTQMLANGLVLRQYLDATGLVFAVAWEGPVLPDFERLLGPHFQAYAAAARQQKRGVNLQDSSVVIESGGMMRSFSGRAYLPNKLPSTWTAQDIR